MKGIVLFAHGSRDPEWAQPFERIRDRLRTMRPERPVALAYLDLMQPTLAGGVAEVVEAGASSVTVVPLFMAQGGHLKEDLPRLVEALRPAFPHVPICLERAVGESDEVLGAIAEWIVERTE